jgi:hypothetical protein
MVGFPYDHVDAWRAIYPAEVLAGQIRKISSAWNQGMDRWARVCDKAETPAQRADAESDRRVATAAGLHFASVANQVEFVLARNALKTSSQPAEREANTATLQRIAREEIAIARQMFALTRQDSRIGYEASNHYYYYPLDMVEKVINCEYILQQMKSK